MRTRIRSLTLVSMVLALLAFVLVAVAGAQVLEGHDPVQERTQERIVVRTQEREDVMSVQVRDREQLRLELHSEVTTPDEPAQVPEQDRARIRVEEDECTFEQARTRVHEHDQLRIHQTDPPRAS